MVNLARCGKVAVLAAGSLHFCYQPAVASPLPLPVYDNIAGMYPLGVGGGSSAIWTLGTPSTNITVVTSLVLNYPALEAPPSGSAGVSVAPSSVLQSLGVSFNPITNGSVYASFLLQMSTPPAGANIMCIAGLDDRTTYTDSPDLAIGVDSSDQLVVGRRSMSVVSSPTPPLVPGQTYLVVVRYNFVPGANNDTVDLWLNPTNLGAAENSVPSATIAGYANTALADAPNLQAFYLVSQISNSGNERWLLSEVRIGTTWAQVTPPDQPVATINTPNNATPSFMYLTGGTTVQFSVAATDQNGNLQTTEWYVNGQLQKTDTNMSGHSGTDGWSYTFNELGTNVVEAVVGNSAGNYSSPAASWTAAMVASQRGMYVDELSSLLGNAAAENSLLQYALENDITYLALYVNSAMLTNVLDSFVQLAKASYGIEQIGFIGENTNDFDSYIKYNNHYAGKADVLNLEYEYWNQTPRDLSGFLARLQYMRSIGIPQGLKVEAYVGWPSNSEMPQICALVDRLLVHCYVTNPSNAYTYGEPAYERWYSAGLATNRPTLWPLFSCESSNNYSEQPFMGDWLVANSLDAAEAIFMDSYSSDTNAMKYNAAILGFQYFSYDFMSPLLFLTATNLSPASLATNASTNTSLVITMNTNVVKGASGNVTIKLASNNSIFASIPITDSRISVSGAHVNINPNASFASGIAYYVLIDGRCFESSSGAFYPGIYLTNGWTFAVK
jgi:hypothetical protein